MTTLVEWVATGAACAAAGGASYAAVITGMMRRGETEREQNWQELQDEQRRTLDRAERNSDWLRGERTKTYSAVLAALHEVVVVYDTKIHGPLNLQPVPSLEPLRPEMAKAVIDLQTAIVAATLVASKNVMVPLADALLIKTAVLLPTVSAGEVPAVANRRLAAELTAIAAVSALMTQEARLSLLDLEPDKLPAPVPLANRSAVSDDDGANVWLLGQYGVAPPIPCDRYEVPDEYFDELMTAYPSWNCPTIRAVIVRENERTFFGVRTSLGDAERAALRKMAATGVELALTEAPNWRAGHEPGSRIYVYP